MRTTASSEKQANILTNLLCSGIPPCIGFPRQIGLETIQLRGNWAARPLYQFLRTHIPYVKEVQLHTNLLFSITAVLACSRIETLMVRCEVLSSIRGIGGLANLTRLSLHWVNINDVLELKSCTNLQELRLEGCGRITSLSGLRGCSLLQVLETSFCGNLHDFSDLSFCDRLTNLNVQCTKVYSLDFLADTASIDMLTVNFCYNLTELDYAACQRSRW